MTLYRNQNWLPNIFNDLFDDANSFATTSLSNMYNVKETNENYLLEFAVPGLKKEDVALKLDKDDNLVVTVGKKRPTVESSKALETENGGSKEMATKGMSAKGMNTDRQVADVMHADAKAAGVEKAGDVASAGSNIANSKMNQAGRRIVKERYLRQNFTAPRFQKVFTLPEDANLKLIAAGVEDGILSITLPKYTPEDIEKEERQITIG